MKQFHVGLVVFFFVSLLTTSHSLEASGTLNFPLNADDATYLKASIRGQFWARVMNHNPGSSFNGQKINQSLDFSIRRVRASVQIKPSHRTFFYLAFGENNFNKKIDRDPEIRLLDLNAEYQFAPQVSIGIGKSGWAGLSRWNVRSSKTMMTLDAPLFYLQTVNINDDLGRAWGAWVKGREGNWDYVFSIRKPKRVPAEIEATDIGFAAGNSQMNYSGYLKYQFLDKESSKTAYSGGCGTYIGKKKVFNLGGGFMYQSRMMVKQIDQNIKFQDYLSWNLEAFFDSPLSVNEDWALTGFVGILNSDFGENYIRRMGANDYAQSGSTWSGSGTDYPMMGTGTTVFFQLGLLHAIGKLRNAQIQPNFAWQYSNFEVLAEKVNVWHGGFNWFIKGHDHKISFGFENRPVFDELASTGIGVIGRRTNWILQYQFELN